MLLVWLPVPFREPLHWLWDMGVEQRCKDIQLCQKYIVLEGRYLQVSHAKLACVFQTILQAGRTKALCLGELRCHILCLAGI